MSGPIAFVSFTDRGATLAEHLQSRFGGTAVNARRDVPFSLAAWTAEAFATTEALVFCGAVGIAVRAIAPHVRSKASDPAVVV
ncbi:MAG: cobalamin biosynthesis protein CbiG, partial [Oscillibacter sp.]|nr:cobalamin biosynthesis protein CbiG [Oscillibacter sp.]